MTDTQLRTIQNAETAFQDLIRPLVPVVAEGQPGIVFGNVEFWIDAIGPWRGQLSFDRPTDQWDAAAIGRDVAAKLQETK